jgi:hypothetical protein
MWLDFPIYAALRSAPSRWLLRAPNDDPFLPAVVTVAAIDEPAYCGHAKRSAVVIRPFDHDRNLTRAEIGNASWRDDLLQLALA